MSEFLQCGRYQLSLQRPLVMGIINTTPDSFSDGAHYLRPERAIAHGFALVEQGAQILDIGGESTRPGSAGVGAAEELARIMPVISALRDCGVPLSVDTCKPEVMRAVLAAGVDMINDVTGFRDPEAIAALGASNCAVCVMHMQGEPRTMQENPHYADVVAEIGQYLGAAAARLHAAGVARERISLDPGFGFGKTVAHNYTLLAELAGLSAAIAAQAGFDFPLLVGLSRKSMLGALTGRPATERLAASVAAALIAVQNGARIIRVHDVAATTDALKILAASSPQPNPS